MRREKVDKFNSACIEAGFKEIGNQVYELKGPFAKTLTLCTLIHGNEIGGMEVFLNLLDMIKSKELVPSSNLRLMLGNVEAYYADKRFLESDLNRSFGIQNPETMEEKRASELEPFLKDTDVLIDIHQTIGPTSTPFFIFEFEENSYNFARHLNKDVPVVTYTTKRAHKGKTTTGYVIQNDALAVTIETGQKGIEDTQISLGLEIVCKAIRMSFEQTFPVSPFTNTYTFHQIIHNPDGSLEMTKQLSNFDKVQMGELLARNHQQEVFSEVDGVVLFPKYGDYAKKSVELSLILKPVNSREEL